MTGTQQPLDGMPRRLLQAAPSRLACFQDCQRRYRFTYLDKPQPPKGPPWAHNAFGASVHAALAAWWRLPAEERAEANIGMLLDGVWQSDGYRDREQEAHARGRARAMLVRYVATVDPSLEPVGVERTVAFKTAYAALFGRVDRIDDRPGEGLVIVDYKTGRQEPSFDDVRSSTALALYAVATSRTLHRPCHRVELHHLPTGTVVGWAHTDEALERHVRRIDSLAKEIADLDERWRAGVDADEADRLYPAAPGPLCAWCDFNRSCPEGAAYAKPREPWAALADN